ncbi:hypothetical protein OEA41_006264 [Lepraria neglecta]|uniref:Uncharacterized protein n=1 Tax=Lepraria neglecta TaxID=209136 RepID=A0AAD9Z8N5_9LECA|nr:hypothetical protein OEA41_006264 [Lepraria neglecta]
MRKGVLGNKGPRVADSMFFVATMLRETGKEAAAAQLLREIVHMSLGVKEMEAHLARALWNLGNAEEATCNRDEAKDLKARAKATRVQIEGRESEDEDTDEETPFCTIVGGNNTNMYPTLMLRMQPTRPLGMQPTRPLFRPMPFGKQTRHRQDPAPSQNEPIREF